MVIIADERDKQGADMGQHLAHYRLNVEVERITKVDVDVADALLLHAADAGANFIIEATAIPACANSCSAA